MINLDNPLLSDDSQSLLKEAVKDPGVVSIIRNILAQREQLNNKLAALAKSKGAALSVSDQSNYSPGSQAALVNQVLSITSARGSEVTAENIIDWLNKENLHATHLEIA